MWKSEEFDYSGLYSAVLADVRDHYPDDASEWRRDELRLRSIIAQEGFRFVAEVLPAVGKHFDMCLSTGSLQPICIAHHRPYKRGNTIPRLFRALYFKVFDDLGVLRSNPEHAAIRFLRQLYFLFKKVKVACDDTAKFKAVSSFWEIERSIPVSTLCWADTSLDIPLHARLHLADDQGGLSRHKEQRPVPRPSDIGLERDQYLLAIGGGSSRRQDGSGDESPQDRQIDTDSALLRPALDICQQVADRVVFSLGQFSPSESRPKHGPGAVADLRSGADKYQFPNWPAKLDFSFPLADFAYANYSLFLEEHDTGQGRVHSQHEPPSRLMAVPKTLKGPRLIAAEPTAHQWCQQVVADYLQRSVEGHSLIRRSVNFSDQTVSGRLALSSSRDGTLATVDLADASDRLSCWLIERMFRSNPELLRYMHSVRTRWIVNDIDKKTPRHIILRKFSTMGSALTFPVQSIVFTIVAIAAVMAERKISVTNANIVRISREVRVFGDDIICPVEHVGLMIELLTRLGLKVNVHKSFWTGWFRESCGVDAYAGTNVTPVYVREVSNKTRSDSFQSTIATSNGLHREGYWRAASWLVSTAPDQLTRKLAVLPFEVGGLALSSFCGRSTDHLKSRWNEALQRNDYRHVSARSRASLCRRDSHATYLQFFTEVAPVDEFGFCQPLSLGFKGRDRSLIGLSWGPCEYDKQVKRVNQHGFKDG